MIRTAIKKGEMYNEKFKTKSYEKFNKGVFQTIAR